MRAPGLAGALSAAFLAAAGIAAPPGPPIAVTGAEFFVDLVGPNGELRHLVTTRVPDLPGVACYRWVLHVAPETRTAAVRERLILPAAASSWGVEEDGGTVVARDRRSADTDLMVGLRQGLIANGWCVAEGDPPGAYAIEVRDGERLLHRFDFTLVAPPGGNGTAAPPTL